MKHQYKVRRVYFICLFFQNDGQQPCGLEKTKTQEKVPGQ